MYCFATSKIWSRRTFGDNRVLLVEAGNLFAGIYRCLQEIYQDHHSSSPLLRFEVSRVGRWSSAWKYC